MEFHIIHQEIFMYIILVVIRLEGGSELTCNAGDVSLIPGWGRSPGEGNGNPL